MNRKYRSNKQAKGDFFREVLLAVIPGLTLTVLGIILQRTTRPITIMVILIASLVITSLFYLWVLFRHKVYTWWAVVAGAVAMITAGTVFGFHLRSIYRYPDLHYNRILSQLCNEQYPHFQNFLLHEAELLDFKKIDNYWHLSHVMAGKGDKPYASAIRAGILCKAQYFYTYQGHLDHGERLPIEKIAGRAGLHLRWDLEKDVWCSMTIETGVFSGILFQRTFDMDRYQRLSFDVFLPQQIEGNPVTIRLEDDSAIRNPNLKVPCSTNQIILQSYLPEPDPNQWTTTPVSIPLDLFNFYEPDAWPYDYDPNKLRTCALKPQEAVPDRHHITQVVFGCIGKSKGEIWITNIRFE